MSKIQFPPDTTGARIGMTEILEKRAEMDSFCRVILGDDCLGSVTAPVAKTYNGDPDFADIAHPVESFFPQGRRAFRQQRLARNRPSVGRTNCRRRVDS
jgi:hypothetical protein